jgi:hypothetical protein
VDYWESSTGTVLPHFIAWFFAGMLKGIQRKALQIAADPSAVVTALAKPHKA